MSQEEVSPETAAETDEITPATVAKLLLFLVWWFSGIGVGTAFLSPGIIGPQISVELFLAIILSHFCSILLIILLIAGPDDTPPSDYQGI